MTITHITDRELELNVLLTEALDMLRYCQEIFNTYAELHAVKGNADKAESNRTIATSVATTIDSIKFKRSQLK